MLLELQYFDRIYSYPPVVFSCVHPEMSRKRKAPDTNYDDEASESCDPEWNDKWKGTAFAGVMNVVHKCDLEHSNHIILANLPADTEALLHATINRADSLHSRRTRSRNIREGPEPGDEFLLAKEDWPIVEKMGQVIDEARRLDAKYGRLLVRFVKASKQAPGKLADNDPFWKAIRRRGLEKEEMFHSVEHALM